MRVYAVAKFLGPGAGILLVAVLAYGSILTNGAGFSHPDDVAVKDSYCCQFRPGVWATVRFNQRFGYWMETNLLLHLLAAGLLYAVSGSLIAALLLAAHPFAADAIASVSGRSGILVALPVLLLVLAWRRYRKLLPLGVILLIPMIGFRPSYWSTVIEGVRFRDHVPAYLAAIGNYILPKMILPFHLSADPDIPVTFLGIFIALIGLSGLGVLAWRFPPYRTGVLLMAAGLLPYLFVPLHDPFFEHRGYLALCGMLVLVAKVVERRWIWAAPLVSLLIVLSIARAEVYRSPVSLWDNAAEEAPFKYRPHFNRGVAHALTHDFSTAEHELQLARVLAPDRTERVRVWQTLGIVYAAQQKLPLAAEAWAIAQRYR